MNRMSEKFSLKWNHFHSNVSKSFSALRSEAYLHDVTLVSDDHNKVAAHKMVLSACSEYFKDIFKNNQHSHPLICLDGLSAADIRNIMDYIYNGELQIDQESLDRFLSIAQRLKLGGLIEDTHNQDELEDTNKKNIIDPENSCHSKSKSTTEMLLSPKIKAKAHPNKMEKVIENVVVPIDIEDLDKIKEKVNEYLEECPDGSYRCTLCGKISSQNIKDRSVKRQSIKRHIESHHVDGLTYTCNFCMKTCKTQNALVMHKSKFHKYC